MSIKKIPLCPFCNSEMKKEQLENVYYHGVLLPTRLKDMQATQTGLLKGIEETIELNLYVCSGCRFAALWKGEH